MTVNNIFYEINPSEYSQLYIVYSCDVLIHDKADITAPHSITSPKRNKEYILGRVLWQHCYPNLDVTKIIYPFNQKPYYPDGKLYFSIAHTHNWIGLIGSYKNEVGIDIQVYSEKINTVKHKFLQDAELNVYNKITDEHQQWLTLHLYWSAKEALFKWYGKRGLSLRTHFYVHELDDWLFRHQKKGAILCTIFDKNKEVATKVHYCFFDDFCLAYIDQGGLLKNNGSITK